MKRSYEYTFYIWGKLALFARKEFNGDKHSYSFPPHSSLRNTIAQIYSKPECLPVISEVEVLNRPEYYTLQYRTRKDYSGTENVGLSYKSYLLDPAYKIKFHFYFPTCTIENLINRDNYKKQIENSSYMIGHMKQFERRVRNSNSYRQPYFGNQECIADFGEQLPENLKLNSNFKLNPDSTYGELLYLAKETKCLAKMDTIDIKFVDNKIIYPVKDIEDFFEKNYALKYERLKKEEVNV